MSALSTSFFPVHSNRDAEGLEDHLPPGAGAIDFEALASGLEPGVLKVLELRSGTPPEAVRAGIDYMEACFRKPSG